MRRFIVLALVLLVAFPVFCAPKTVNIGAFNAEDFFGNKVDSTIFKDYDVTMINFFTTTCVYCMCELQSLCDVKARMPEGGNIVAVIGDGYDDSEDVAEAVRTFPVDFKHLKMSPAQLTSIPYLLGYPTTLFVDREGNILKVITTALNHPTEMYLAALNELLGEGK